MAQYRAPSSHSWPQLNYLYKAFDSQGTLLYVGVSKDALSSRLGTHAKHSDWWPFATNFDYRRYYTRREVLDAERKAIEIERPIYNRTFNGDPDSCSARIADYEAVR